MVHDHDGLLFLVQILAVKKINSLATPGQSGEQSQPDSQRSRLILKLINCYITGKQSCLWCLMSKNRIYKYDINRYNFN